MKYYLLSLYRSDPKKCFPLGLESRTLKDAERGLNWQMQGSVERDELAIAERTGSDTFKCIETGKEYKAYNGAYIKSAWDDFLNEVAA